MRYVPCWKKLNIEPDRYQELLHFCRQYSRWLSEANSLLGITAIKMDLMPHGSGKSDPVAMAAEKRETLLSKIAIVDECARSVGHGEWYTALIEIICNKQSYKLISETKKFILPTYNINAFYKARTDFFDLLNKKKT